MKMHKGVLAVACLAALTLAVGALAQERSALQLSAKLSSVTEVPPPQFNNPRAVGHFSGTLKRSSKGYRLYWKVSFAKLSGAATSAYIHVGKPGAHGAAILRLCAPCHGSGASGNSYFSPGELRFAREHRLYVNVRTAKNPAGEIRGQIVVSS